MDLGGAAKSAVTSVTSFAKGATLAGAGVVHLTLWLRRLTKSTWEWMQTKVSAAITSTAKSFAGLASSIGRSVLSLVSFRKKSQEALSPTEKLSKELAGINPKATLASRGLNLFKGGINGLRGALTGLAPVLAPLLTIAALGMGAKAGLEMADQLEQGALK